MNKLILVRHGQYDDTGHLTEQGREQINRLSQKLKSLLNKENIIAIFSSPTERTSETASIIGEALSVEFKESEVLWSEGPLHPMNLSGALDLIRLNKKVDVIIFVTHFDYLADFPKYFSEIELGIKLPSIEIGKGEAWVVDCIQKTLTLVNIILYYCFLKNVIYN